MDLFVEWYILNNSNQESGPYAAEEVKKVILSGQPICVWKEGSLVWQHPENIDIFSEACQKASLLNASKSKPVKKQQSEVIKKNYLKGIAFFSVLLLITIGVCSLGSSLFVSHIPIDAYVIDIFGTAYINNKLAKEKDRLNLNDTIETKSNSRMQIAVDPKTLLSLSENTKIKVTKFLFHKDSIIEVTFYLIYGYVRSTLMQKSFYNINTPNITIGVRGTDFITSEINGISNLYTLTGLVLVNDKEEVSPGFTVVASKTTCLKRDTSVEEKEEVIEKFLPLPKDYIKEEISIKQTVTKTPIIVPVTKVKEEEEVYMGSEEPKSGVSIVN